MTEGLLTTASPQVIEKMIEEWAGHTHATDILDDLDPELAVTRREGWPYTIAGLVAHMRFWQAYVHEEIETGESRKVAAAAESWTGVTAAEWAEVRDEFLAGLEKSKAMARDPELLDRPFRPGATQSVGVKLLSLVSHDSYHLGQVVLLRRLLGAWPPPSGGDTW